MCQQSKVGCALVSVCRAREEAAPMISSVVTCISFAFSLLAKADDMAVPICKDECKSCSVLGDLDTEHQDGMILSSLITDS